MSKFDKYIGIPFKDECKSFDCADCRGLIWLIYKEEKDIVLPENLLDDKTWNKNLKLYHNKIRVYPPFKPFDVIFFYNRERSFVDHVGLYIEENKFLHTFEDKESTIDRFSGYWESRMWKAYRWQN